MAQTQGCSDTVGTNTGKEKLWALDRETNSPALRAEGREGRLSEPINMQTRLDVMNCQENKNVNHSEISHTILTGMTGAQKIERPWRNEASCTASGNVYSAVARRTFKS